MNLLTKIFVIWFSLNQKLRFILVGGYNTVFAYLVFCLLEKFVGLYLHYLVILVLAHCISTSNSFFNFRFFVFRSRGNFFHEYLRTNLVYLGYLVCNAAMLYILKDLLQINVLLAQLICVIILTIVVYFVHKNYSFKQR